MDSLSVSELSVPADSLSQLLPLDSLFADSIPLDTLATDTVPKKKKDMLDAPVKYESTDSTVWTKGGYASLYGESKIEYENIYFYVFDFQDSKQNIILTVEDKEIVINKDNRYGILGTIEDNLVQEIYFTLSYYGNSNNYLYK